MATVTLSQLSRRYGRFRAVDGIDLVIHDGESLVLLGPGGCGKSTVLRLIAGLIVPTGGSVALDGRVISSSRGVEPLGGRGMGLLFHSVALFAHMTVAENVGYGLRQRGLEGADLHARVDAAIELAGITGTGGRYPRLLSAEAQQRVALARAIAVRPRVLLLDDALAALETQSRRRLAADIRGIARRIGLTLIAVTGDTAEALVLADRIAAMRRGRIEQVDTPGALYMRPETGFVATLMGRALLLAAMRKGNRIEAGGIALDAARVRDGAGPAGPVTLCIRPEHLGLVPRGAALPEGCVGLAGHVRERTFVGTHWDYAIVPDAPCPGAPPEILVAAPNTTVFEAGTGVQVVIDPAMLAVAREART